MIDREKQKVRYWNDFCDHLNSRGSQFQFPTYRGNHYINFRIEEKCWVMVRQVIKPKPGELTITLCIEGPNRENVFNALREQQAEIENEFGESLEWQGIRGRERRDQKRLHLIKADVDPADETDWPNQHEWLATKLEKFNEVFRPRIVALNAGAWSPLEKINTEEESFVEKMKALREQLTREFAETRDVLKSVVEEIRGVREDLKIVRRGLGDIV